MKSCFFDRDTRAPDGIWSPNAARLVPRGTVEWSRVGSIAVSGSIGGKPVAVLRGPVIKGGYLARVDGWQWKVTPDMGVARMNTVPGNKITHTSSKLFPTISAAKREVEAILAKP